MSSNASIWLSKESSEPTMAVPQLALKGNAYLEFIMHGSEEKDDIAEQNASRSEADASPLNYGSTRDTHGAPSVAE